MAEWALRRDDLLDRLNAARASRLLVIAAPAGFGKTMLVEEWVRELDDDVGVGWLTVDERDGDPVRFWLHFVESLRRVGGVVDDRLIDEVLWHHSSIDELVAATVNSLASLDGQQVLVVDDLHLVDLSGVIGPFFRLVDALPSNTTMVVVGRTVPAWPLQRLQALGEVEMLTVDDLAFTRGETATVVGKLAPGALLDDAEIDLLFDKSEGWPVAVRLAAHGLSRHRSPHRLVAEFGGSNGAVAGFLLEEVLSSLGPGLHRFLLDVSVLDQFTADLAGAVVDRPAGHLVDQLLAEHLFVASIDERRERFRLHHLIRDLLLADLEATDPARVRVLRRRAAKWYEAQGDIGASVEHLVAAGDNDDAIALIQNLLDQIYLTGQLDSGIQWLQQVPHEHLEQRPTAASMLARMLTERGWFDDARAWIDVAARAAMTELEQLDVIRARVRLEHALGKEAEVLSTLAELDSLVDFACEPRARELAASEQASTLAIRAMSHEFLGQEENRRAALTDLERRRPQLAEATAVVVDPILARAYAEDGELRTAASQGRLAIRRARRKGLELPALAHAYLAMAQVEWCQGRLDEAEAMLRDAVQLDDGGGVWIRTLRAVRAAEILASLGRHDQVDDVLESAWQGTPGARTPPTSRWMIAGWGLAINAIHGRRESAYSWLAELDRFQAPNSAPAFLWAEAELLKGNPNAVVTRFGPDGDSLPRQPLPRLRCGLALARALDATDRETELVPLVEELLAHAEVNDLLQPLLESRELLVRIGSTWSVVSSPRFLGRIRAPKPRQVAPPPIAQLPEPISPRELDLIRLLPTRLTNQEIASELYVSLNTVKSHLRSIYRKLGATSRDGAIGRCRDLGLLDEGVPSSPQRDDDGLRSVQQA